MLEDLMTPGFERSTIMVGSRQIVRYHYQSIDSTQFEARRTADRVTPGQWYLCTANTQTSGIGQHDRTWSSPEGLNVYASFVFTSYETDFKKKLSLPHITVLSVLNTLEHFGINNGKFKWVNDTCVDQKKIAGILVQEVSTGIKIGSDCIPYQTYAIGVGVNVNLNNEETLKISQPASSMLQILKHPLPVDDVVEILAANMYTNIEDLLAKGFLHFRDILEPKLETFYGQPIIFDTENSTGPYIVGKIIGLFHEYGQLLFLDTDNNTHKFSYGRILKGTDIAEAIQLTHIINKLVKTEHFDALPSTTLFAKEHLDIVADNFWHAITSDYKKESISVTYVLPYYGGLTTIQLSQISALSIQETLKLFECNAKIKWMKDIILENKKIAENHVEIIDILDKKVCLISMELNVNQSNEEDVSATSIKKSTNSDVDLVVAQVYTQLTKTLFYNFQIAINYGYQKIQSSIEAVLANIKHQVLVRDNNTDQMHIGIFNHIGSDGSMQLQTTEDIIVILNGSIVEDYGIPIHQATLVTEYLGNMVVDSEL